MATTEQDAHDGHGLDAEFEVECEQCGGDCAIPGPVIRDAATGTIVKHSTSTMDQPCPGCGSSEAGRTLLGTEVTGYRLIACMACQWQDPEYMPWVFPNEEG